MFLVYSSDEDICETEAYQEWHIAAEKVIQSIRRSDRFQVEKSVYESYIPDTQDLTHLTDEEHVNFMELMNNYNYEIVEISLYYNSFD